MMAVMNANRATYHRVARRAFVSLAAGRHRPTMSRSHVDAITSSTLSREDMAAATMATTRNAPTVGLNTVPLLRRVGTTRSVSTISPGMILRA